MIIETLLKPLFLLLWVIGEEILLASDWDFVAPGPGCKQLTGTVQKKELDFRFTFVFTTERKGKGRQHHKVDNVQEK